MKRHWLIIIMIISSFLLCGIAQADILMKKFTAKSEETTITAAILKYTSDNSRLYVLMLHAKTEADQFLQKYEVEVYPKEDNNPFGRIGRTQVTTLAYSGYPMVQPLHEKEAWRIVYIVEFLAGWEDWICTYKREK